MACLPSPLMPECVTTVADGSAEILLQRAAQYSAFVALLKANNQRALASASLLRPTALVGTSTR
jgi:hypothetical protein